MKTLFLAWQDSTSRTWFPYVQSLSVGTRLFINHDVQNEFDSRALILRTEDLHFVGYCPRYFTQDFFELICNFPKQVNVTIERVNPSPTPIQFRLLCSLTAKWSDDFHPFSDPIFQILRKDLQPHI